MKRCEYCGKELVGRQKKFCSQRCSSHRYKNYYYRCESKVENSPRGSVDYPKGTIGNCFNCGKKFTRTFDNEKYCSDDCRIDFFKHKFKHLNYTAGGLLV